MASRPIDARGIVGGRPDDIRRGLASAPGSPKQPPDRLVASATDQPKPTTKGSVYAQTAHRLVDNLKNTATYGPQTDMSGLRKPDFLKDDTQYDCTKFVLVTLLEADKVDYRKETFQGIRVAALRADVADVTAVGDESSGMMGAMVKLWPIKRDPKPGDIAVWMSRVVVPKHVEMKGQVPIVTQEHVEMKGHVAIVTAVQPSSDILSLAWAGGKLGSLALKEQQIQLAELWKEVDPDLKHPGSRGPFRYGSGAFKGFWTPAETGTGKAD